MFLTKCAEITQVLSFLLLIFPAIKIYVQKRKVASGIMPAVEPNRNPNWQGWAIIFIVFIGIASTIYLAAGRSNEVAKSPVPMSYPSRAISIPGIHTNLEAILESPGGSEKGVQRILWRAALDAYKTNNYPYCVALFEKAKDMSFDDEWRMHLPYIVVSELAMNPTAKGYAQFEKQLNDLVLEIDQKANNSNMYLSRSTPLGNVLTSLYSIKAILPESERPFIDGIIASVKTRKNRPGIKE